MTYVPHVFLHLLPFPLPPVSYCKLGYCTRCIPAASRTMHRSLRMQLACNRRTNVFVLPARTDGMSHVRLIAAFIAHTSEFYLEYHSIFLIIKKEKNSLIRFQILFFSYFNYDVLLIQCTIKLN